MRSSYRALQPVNGSCISRSSRWHSTTAPFPRYRNLYLKEWSKWSSSIILIIVEITDEDVGTRTKREAKVIWQRHWMTPAQWSQVKRSRDKTDQQTDRLIDWQALHISVTIVCVSCIRCSLTIQNCKHSQWGHWEVPSCKSGPGQPWTNSRGVVKKDLQRMELTWEEAGVAALNRLEWRRCVAQYIHMDVGRTKVSLKHVTSICDLVLRCLCICLLTVQHTANWNNVQVYRNFVNISPKYVLEICQKFSSLE